MIAIRNIIIHEYFRIDVEILWQTIVEDVPPILPALKAILDIHEDDV
ncbi:MAG: DUF86 domain-containing protein [Anaerolineaceae bacterium]|jgi:uncharacterized protein with HEPN domain|nr:DUF86 domain-containing protein [Anaerolineaceae bacterium]